jgi:hypothetical protein
MSTVTTAFTTELMNRFGTVYVRPSEREAVLLDLLNAAYAENAAMRARMTLSQSGILDEVMQVPTDEAICGRLNDLIKARWGKRLTRQELALISLMARVSPRVLNKFHIVECLPEYRGRGEDRNLSLANVMINHIRTKTCREVIENVYGEGWVIGAPMLELLRLAAEEPQTMAA